jgi:glutamate-5-semialdehyde dehydrogenase
MSAHEALARGAKEAAAALRTAAPERKTAAIRAMAARIRDRRAQVLEANRADLAAARDLGDAKRDRLALNEKRIDEVVRGLEAVAAIEDPVGKVVDERRGLTGIRVRRVRVPIGVILMIFEARPNVTAEAAALCLRSSNAALLRGGRE